MCLINNRVSAEFRKFGKLLKFTKVLYTIYIIIIIIAFVPLMWGLPFSQVLSTPLYPVPVLSQSLHSSHPHSPYLSSVCLSCSRPFSCNFYLLFSFPHIAIVPPLHMAKPCQSLLPHFFCYISHLNHFTHFFISDPISSRLTYHPSQHPHLSGLHFSFLSFLYSPSLSSIHQGRSNH